jgi:metal-sulfur cluster biosynthetic enzyme
MAAAAAEAAVREALGKVVDPCSRFIGSNLSFAELGMIDDVKIADDGSVDISLLLDDPTCLYIVEIEREIRLAALSVPGVTAAAVSVRWDEIWTDERATDEARSKLHGGRRQHSAAGALIPLESLRTGGSR